MKRTGQGEGVRERDETMGWWEGEGGKRETRGLNGREELVCCCIFPVLCLQEFPSVPLCNYDFQKVDTHIVSVTVYVLEALLKKIIALLCIISSRMDSN